MNDRPPSRDDRLRTEAGQRPPAGGLRGSRRRFLAAAGGLAALGIVPRHVLGGAGQIPPSDRPRLAGVGVGGVGFGHLAGCEKAGFGIAVLCDVDDVYAKRYLKEEYRSGWSLEG